MGRLLFPALNAKELYFGLGNLVDQGEVKIVDEFTGRVMEGRRWNGGLHQAVEAKEKVDENPTSYWPPSRAGTVLVGLSLSGMTGTAPVKLKSYPISKSVWKSTSRRVPAVRLSVVRNGIATPSSRRRVDGVETTRQFSERTVNMISNGQAHVCAVHREALLELTQET